MKNLVLAALLPELPLYAFGPGGTEGAERLAGRPAAPPAAPRPPAPHLRRKTLSSSSALQNLCACLAASITRARSRGLMGSFSSWQSAAPSRQGGSLGGSPPAPCPRPPLTQHEHHLPAQAVVDVQRFLAVVVLLAVAGVGAHHGARHHLRHGAGGGAASARGGAGSPHGGGVATARRPRSIRLLPLSLSLPPAPPPRGAWYVPGAPGGSAALGAAHAQRPPPPPFSPPQW